MLIKCFFFYQTTTTALTKNGALSFVLSCSSATQLIQTSVSKALNVLRKQNHQSLALTSPESDSRCCWRELASLVNLFLGPTRSAKLPMMILLWPWCTPLVSNLKQCLSLLAVFFVYLHNAFLLPLLLRHWHTYTHLTFQRHSCRPPKHTRTHRYFP